MPVISPRRSSTSGSSNLYASTTSARATGGDSGLGSPSTNRFSSYFERAGSLSKLGPSSTSSYSPSNYSSYLSSYSPSTYTPRTSAYRSPSSSYLSGGSSALDNYRNSYLGSNDSNSYSRYGLRKPPIANSESLTKDKNDQTSGITRRNEARKPPTGASNPEKRLSASLSSSSLARLVATSGLDIYEKYSPAHYKTSTELSRSRSELNEAAVDEAAAKTVGVNNEENNAEQKHKERDRRRNEVTDISTTVTLERPRSRYSRLYSKDIEDDVKKEDAVDNATVVTLGSRKKAVSKLSNSGSSGDIPTVTVTLRSRSLQRASKTKSIHDENGDDDNDISKNNLKNNSSRPSIISKSATKSTKIELNEPLKNGISSTNPTVVCNGMLDDHLSSATKRQLKLSSSTSDLKSNENDRKIERSASDSGNIGSVGINGDVNAITKTNLDIPTTTTVASKNKISPYRTPITYCWF